MARIVVVGAGCFGAWTAYHLVLAGHDVILVDAYGPGNSRSSSGGETRVIRMGYGDRANYTRWSRQSLDQWKAIFERTSAHLFHETGVLWMTNPDEGLARSTADTLAAEAIPHERLSSVDLESRWPQIRFSADARGLFEPS